MNVKEAKLVPLLLILEKINCQPVRDRKKERVYFSPFRNEKTPSFFVDPTKNAWYDFGIGKGGNPLDFSCAYLASQGEAGTIQDALRWLSNLAGGMSVQGPHPLPAQVDKEPALTVKKVSPVKHRALTGYLAKRGIPLAIASPYLVELNVYNTESKKRFFSLGMCNEEEGYELRNPFFKGCAGRKAISFIRGSQPKPPGIHLFEGMFDFLSALAYRNTQQFPDDAIVLHSLSCLKGALPYIVGYGYRTAFTWLDNDTAGAKATGTLKERFKAEAGLRHQPMNRLYHPHKDVNAWQGRTPSLPSLSL